VKVGNMCGQTYLKCIWVVNVVFHPIIHAHNIFCLTIFGISSTQLS